MAEVAAGAGIVLAVEEVLSTTVQVGAAGYFLTKPTQPLKATFTRIATAHDDEMKRRSLTRSSHSLTVLNNKAYIFGGSTPDSKVATSDVHVINLAPGKEHEPDYQMIPAIPSSENGSVPGPRTKHAACVFESQVAVYGGTNELGRPIDEDSCIWLFNPKDKTWNALKSDKGAGGATPGSREGARIFALEKTILLYGGTTSEGRVSSDLWRFSAESKEWHALPNPPSLASPTNAALANDHLYLVSSSDPMSSQLHMLPLKASTGKGSGDAGLEWGSLTFPTNPLVPGPRARHDGALLPITTGYGRNYLVYLLGARDTTSPEHADKDADPTQWSDTWALQLPSSSLEPKPALSLGKAIKPAHVKDVIRSGVGADSGKWTWAEVEVTIPSDLGAEEGKLHPGPRALFGADVGADERSVVFWGGADAEGNAVGDGWVVRLE
ncbi:galactose oxidase [Massarina eburnea CBS 473.64]|uniref:Galactose oxidase n=1 Tax=Massarina eburnea CBS 473.64 TaxID=1395130 RepID=A0A6A6RH21_9PLEO|nr:galactose oxidase [Massarina eburnea CBS 473.64]